jgi:hypothetical protein
MTDKIKHIAAGLGIALVIALPCWLETNNLFAGLWACLSGIIGGGVKEFTDNKHDGCEWDWLDFGCTCLGAVLVALLIVGLHYGKG